MLGMRLSARADYALRAAVELAASSGDHTTAEQLARAQHIPAKFLEAILTQLRRAGLVRSQRGPEGGFWLAKPAEEISLGDIIRAVDGQLVGVRGERPENLGYIGAAEPLQSVWIALRANERAILDEVTLDHIVTNRLPDRVLELTNDPEPGPAHLELTADLSAQRQRPLRPPCLRGRWAGSWRPASNSRTRPWRPRACEARQHADPAQPAIGQKPDNQPQPSIAGVPGGSAPRASTRARPTAKPAEGHRRAGAAARQG